MSSHSSSTPPVTSSGIFNVSTCHPSDHRYKLYEQLSRESVDEEAIASLVRARPKIFSYEYIFRYPFSKKKRTTIFPLSRLLCLRPSLDLVKLVHNAYPDAMTARDKDGRYPLHYACRFRASKEVVHYVISEYPDAIKKKLKTGTLAIHHASGNKQHVDVVKELVECGGPDTLQVVSKFDMWSPLHFASAYHPAEGVIIFLLQCYPDGAKMLARNEKLPLHFACECQHSLIRSLPDIRAIVSAYPEAVRITDRFQMLPMHCACRKQAPTETVQYLVQCYPEAVKAVSQEGKTPLDYAKDEASGVTVKFLEEVITHLDELVDLSTERRGEALDSIIEKVLRVTAKTAPTPDDSTPNKSDSTKHASSPPLSSQHMEWKARQKADRSATLETEETPSQQGEAQTTNAMEREEIVESVVASHDDKISTDRSIRYASQDELISSPGAVRVRGIDAADVPSDDDERNSASEASIEGESSIQQSSYFSSSVSVVTNTPIAAEIAPRVAELEAELEDYKRRLDSSKEIIEADEVIPDPTSSAVTQAEARCCILL